MTKRCSHPHISILIVQECWNIIQYFQQNLIPNSSTVTH